jgi:hypothetical protein
MKKEFGLKGDDLKNDGSKMSISFAENDRETVH